MINFSVNPSIPIFNNSVHQHFKIYLFYIDLTIISLLPEGIIKYD